MNQGIDHPYNKDRSKFDFNRTDTGPRFERISGDPEQEGSAMPSQYTGTRSRRNSRETRDNGKLFTITDKARIVAASKERRISLKDSMGLARIAIDNAYFESYKPKQMKSTVAQLVDLEEDMANDDFDYSVFVKKEVLALCNFLWAAKKVLLPSIFLSLCWAAPYVYSYMHYV